MPLQLQPYLKQKNLHPRVNRSILAGFGPQPIGVYQPSTDEFSARNSHLAANFSLNPMSGIKPNFL